MFIFETKYLLWSIILLIFDIIVTIFYNKFEESKKENLEKSTKYFEEVKYKSGD